MSPVALTPDLAQRAYATQQDLVRALGEAAPRDSGMQEELSRYLRAASRAIEARCNRLFLREQVTERVVGDGGVYLMVSRCPVLQVVSITYQTESVLSTVIHDADAGLIYRAQGWADTRGYGWGLSRQARAEFTSPDYTVVYVGGFLVGSENVASRTVSVSAAQKAYLDSANGFPLLVAGDRIRASGFATPANNGWKTVVSRTAGVVVVAEAGLVDEAVPAESGDARFLQCATIPEDIVQACVETAKAWYLARDRDRTVRTVSVGDLAVGYEGGETSEGPQAIPFTARALLSPWTRLA